MRVLALDTSTKSQVLALMEGTDVVARRMSRVRVNHSETLLANVDDMLAQARWTIDSLELVTAGLGPGTFTGLRVGLATAKGIARGAGAPIVGVSSLAATANPVTSLFDGTVVALCDARRGEVYCGAYRRDEEGLETVVPPHAAAPRAIRTLVEGIDDEVVVVGNGLRAYPELQDWDRPDVQTLAQPWDGPSSVSIALLGRRRLEHEGADDLAALEPDYVRLSDAEVNIGPPDATSSVPK
jgi:tRNA threonylcarbamoyladenosine biosynthesis protein TsaB